METKIAIRQAKEHHAQAPSPAMIRRQTRRDIIDTYIGTGPRSDKIATRGQYNPSNGSKEGGLSRALSSGEGQNKSNLKITVTGEPSSPVKKSPLNSNKQNSASTNSFFALLTGGGGSPTPPANIPSKEGSYNPPSSFPQPPPSLRPNHGTVNSIEGSDQSPPKSLNLDSPSSMPVSVSSNNLPALASTPEFGAGSYVNQNASKLSPPRPPEYGLGSSGRSSPPEGESQCTAMSPDNGGFGGYGKGIMQFLTKAGGQ